MVIFHVLRLGQKYKHLQAEDINKYITISYAQVEEDWTQNNTSPFKFTPYATKNCTYDDFGDDEES